ncbi:RidA family protein [Microbacterium sp. 18062]|uniref:RidA family protein n=1 Tax=Microbacterium sp. 18062 TaxID=2681410 RepID=UPI001356E7C3|nr:RidA family protein [Microbacterium sp. 18062]
MSKTEIRSAELASPNGHFSHATAIEASGTLVFISGLTARNAAGEVVGVGDVTAQTHQVCKNLRAAVAEAGGTLEDIVRVDVYVRNIRDFDEIHAVRRQYFTGIAPASTLVEVAQMVNKDYLIEISAIAVVPKADR